MRTNTKVLLTTALAASVAVGVSAPAANARGPQPSGTSASLELVVASGPDNVPNWGEQITFNVSQTATTEPHVDVLCSQGGATVYSATTGYYASYPWPWTQVMTLSSQKWTGGAASCVAKLYYFNGRKTPVLKTISFEVGA
jgi:hypothetical protein